MKNIFLSLFTTIAMVSCSSMANSKAGNSQTNIAGTKWTLADQVKGKTPTMNLEGGKITGNGGCNNYFGEVLLDATAGNFSAKNIASTQMACEEMSVESNFFSMLNQVDKYVMKGTTLELYKGNLLLLKFNKL